MYSLYQPWNDRVVEHTVRSAAFAILRWNNQCWWMGHVNTPLGILAVLNHLPHSLIAKRPPPKLIYKRYYIPLIWHHKQ